MVIMILMISYRRELEIVQSLIFAFVVSTSLLFNPISGEPHEGIDSIVEMGHGILNEQGKATITGSRINIALKIKNYNPNLTFEQVDLIIKSVNKYCKKYNIPEGVVFAIIAAESKYYPKCRGSLDDTGLMQIREKYASSWAKGMEIDYNGASTLYDIENNVHMGVYILDFLFNRYDSQLDKVLIAYNRGHGYVDRALKIGKKLPSDYLTLVEKHYKNIFEQRLQVS